MKTKLLMMAAVLAVAACGGKKDEVEGPEQIAPPVEETSAPQEGVATALYTFNCGTIAVSDLDIFATDDSYAGATDVFTDSCFVIRHPKGDLLWDLGLPAALVGQEPQTNGPFTVSLQKTLIDEMAVAGLTPADIDLVSISHSHFDHTGQPEAAGEATWLVNSKEHDFMFDEANEADYSAFKSFETKIFEGDLDVFGDGAVRIFELPGHTPGHTVLLVNLAEAGPVMLTGDMYHRKESREGSKVPRFNFDEALTRNSMDRFEALAEATKAMVIIQHEPDDIAKLPKAPEALR